MRSVARRNRRIALPWGLAGLSLVLALALAAPLIAPQGPSDPLGFDPLAANHPPSLSWTYLLGADARGRSVLALLLWGSRVTLAIGIGAAVLAAALGLLLGLLSCWRGSILNAPLSRLMEGCQAVPPLLPALLLAGRLGSVPWPLLLAVFALTGWVAPARLTRAIASAEWRAPYVDAARALGAGGPRLLAVHLLPGVAPPLAAWAASGAATYVALEAGLDFLGLGLPSGAISWGTALAGAQDALPAGNWWWMACGGLALAAATLTLGALARGLAEALQPGAARRDAAPSALDQDENAPATQLGDAWRTWPSRAASGARWRGGQAATIAGGVVVLAGMLLGAAQALHVAARPAPDAAALLARAASYTRRMGLSAAYIAMGDYAATEAMVAGHPLPWSAWDACPSGMPGRRCAHSEALIWYRDGQERAQAEGNIVICAPHRSWVYNPMAGVAQDARRGCAALGPDFGQLGITAGAIAALLPALRAAHPRVAGADVVAGRHCWSVDLSSRASVCVDAASGLALRVQRLNRLGQPVASFTLTGLSFGVDMAPQLFADPIPGGRGPFVSGLTQPLLDLQEADDLGLFTTLVPSVVPAGLIAQTPTFDSFYDATRGYAPQQRVRQAFVDGRGRVSLVLIETSPRSAWDVTPASGPAQRITVADQALRVWPATPGAAAVVRRAGDDTAAIISSRVLPLAVLERVAAGLR